jgi:hypothetical protein
MSDQQQSIDDRQHATELQKTLERWRVLRLASQTSLHILAEFDPADDQTHEARAIVAALREHGRPTARFVAGQVGSSGSAAVLWLSLSWPRASCGITNRQSSSTTSA